MAKGHENNFRLSLFPNRFSYYPDGIYADVSNVWNTKHRSGFGLGVCHRVPPLQPGFQYHEHLYQLPVYQHVREKHVPSHV